MKQPGKVRGEKNEKVDWKIFFCCPDSLWILLIKNYRTIITVPVNLGALIFKSVPIQYAYLIHM